MLSNLINVIEGGKLMQHEHNDSIACTVDECKFHCKDDEYCTLNKIQVGKHETTANSVECTDCDSFQKK